MNINQKGLLEKKNYLMAELEKMMETCEVENRSMSNTEFELYEAKEKEVRAISKTILEFEKRSKENSTVEIIGGNKNMDNLEVRQALLDTLEGRALTYGGNSGLVPEYLHGEVVKSLPEVAPLFSRCDILTPVHGTVRVAVEGNIGEASFVGENEELAVAELAHNFVEMTQKRAGSAMEITQHLINDAGIDIINYVQDVLFRRLGYAIDRAMITGDGVKGLEGLKNAPASCKVALSGTGLVIEDLMNMAVNMKTVYAKNAVFVMNRSTFAKLALMKDGNGHFYIVRENEVDGEICYKLFGHEILVNDAADKIYLVNFRSAYKCMVKKSIDLVEVQDRANALKGLKTFVMSSYIDAKIVQPEAIRYLA